jgi:hypothetical protein
MRATPNLNFTVVEPTKKSLDVFVTMLRSVYQNLVNVINGNLGFGDGTNADNINGVWINVVAPVAPNTDFTVTHNLNRLPVGYWPMQKDRACDVYTGSVAATQTQLTLRATVASAVLRLFVVVLLLGLIVPRSEAQGASHQNFAAVAVNTAAGSGILKVIPSAVITVCNGAVLPPAGSTCSGTALIFVDNALTLPLSNPFNADIRGNYVFFAAAGQNYIVSVGGAGVVTQSYVWIAPFVGGSPNPARTGTIRLASSDTISWRNFANNGDISISKTGASSGTIPADTLFFVGGFGLDASFFGDNNGTQAASGSVRLGSTSLISWRNNANNADVSLSKNASDNLVYSNGLSLGGSLQSSGTSTVVTGTGACATITNTVGGPLAGSFKCTGVTGAASVTITFTLSTPLGWFCAANDLTTRANLLQQTGQTSTSCLFAATTVTQNDIFNFLAVAF